MLGNHKWANFSSLHESSLIKPRSGTRFLDPKPTEQGHRWFSPLFMIPQMHSPRQSSLSGCSGVTGWYRVNLQASAYPVYAMSGWKESKLVRQDIWLSKSGSSSGPGWLEIVPLKPYRVRSSKAECSKRWHWMFLARAQKPAGFFCLEQVGGMNNIDCPMGQVQHWWQLVNVLWRSVVDVRMRNYVQSSGFA